MTDSNIQAVRKRSLSELLLCRQCYSCKHRFIDSLMSNSTRPAFLVAHLVKNMPAMWETWVRPLGWEDPLEKEKATHFSILAWRIL